jgi:predicted DsbA family dithiol-disulfide isomerase
VYGYASVSPYWYIVPSPSWPESFVPQQTALLAIAQCAGLPAKAAQTALQDTVAHDSIAEQEAEMLRIGISGVLYFIINRQIGVSGAQTPDNLLAAMSKLWSLQRLDF